jgi:hypothetical protein
LTERYIGYYTHPGFWAGETVDPNNLEGRPDFETLMSEWVVNYGSGENTLAVCRDGMILLRVPSLQASGSEYMFGDTGKKAQLWEQYLDYFNCLLLLLDSASVTLMKYVPGYFDLRAISRHDTMMLYFQDGKEVQFSFMKSSANSMRSAYYERFPKMYPTGFVDEFRFRNAIRATVPRHVFDVVQREFSIITGDPLIRTQLSTITKSIGEHKDGNYALSLVIAWFVIESILTQKWGDFVESRNTVPSERTTKRVNKRRKDNLLNGRDYTVSVIANILELADVIPFDVFSQVDEIRGNRNRIVHQQPTYTCTSEHSQQAIMLALKLATETSGLELQPNLSSRMLGP